MSEKKPKRGGLFGKLFGGPSDQSTLDHTRSSDETDDDRKTVEPAQTEESGGADAGVEASSPSTDSISASEQDNFVEDEPAPQREPDEKPATQPSADESTSWMSRLTKGLKKTSSQLGQGITSLFTQKKLDDATLDDLEDILIQADLGIETAMRIRDQISDGRFDKGITSDQVQGILADEVERVLQPVAKPLTIHPEHQPHVILMVGVNGTGKTTTIGKLAARYRSEGLNVMIAAGDTFRAAAIDQLKVWGERSDVIVVSREVGSDAAGLAFDALEQAQQDNVDVLLIDTAGRLQNKQALMQELEKVIRVLRKRMPDAPHDTLLVLDATTGQNAVSQVEAFRSTAGVTGLIMTKLDGTARGGILVAIADKYGLPVHAIGVGEGIGDLQPFDAREFASAIAGR